MLSLLLNKNPWLSLGGVSHRLLWSVAVWQEGESEVSRQEGQVDRWMDGLDCECDFRLMDRKGCLLLEVYKMLKCLCSSLLGRP